MNITKKQIGTHVINWAGAFLILILSFFRFLFGQNIWSSSGDFGSLLLIILVPLGLAGLSLFITNRDKELHLAWIIFTSMGSMLLFMLYQFSSAFGSLGSVFGQSGSPVSFAFYLIFLIYMILLFYNSAAILGRVSKLQEDLGEKTGPALENLRVKAKDLGDNIRDKTSKKEEPKIEDKSENN